jgi:hypothetical protein
MISLARESIHAAVPEKFQKGDAVAKSVAGRLTNSWQIDGRFLRFCARPFATDKFAGS